jgi:lysophospholipase L1-like esterase
MLQGAGAITAEQREKLALYEQVRQTTQTDIIPLATGGVLGTLADPENPASVKGIGVPLGDQYALIPSEITAIETARAGYNEAIRDVAETYPEQVALADVDVAFTTFLANKAAISNGITITPNINPPTGIYSEDGMHPNSRGYAFIANIFIDAINEKFGSTLLKADLSKYSATALPINP